MKTIPNLLGHPVCISIMRLSGTSHSYCIPLIVALLQDGWVADIYTGRLDPLTDLTKIDQLVLELESMAERKHYLKGK